MRKALSFASAMFIANMSFAQLELPVPSPKAKVEQRVGITDVSIEYARPAVAGRKIWDGLVPYGKVWRTGANAATLVTFGKDVEIDGKTVKAGEYALFSIPQKEEWTFIINTNEGQKGSVSHKEELDVVRIKAKSSSLSPIKERLEFTVDPISDSEGLITLRWESVEVSFPFKTSTVANAKNNLEVFGGKTQGLWYELAQAARYSNNNGLLENKALEWIDLSITINPDHFFNKWIKAQILSKKGDKENAYTYALAAKEHGEKNPSGFYDAYKTEIEKGVADLAAFAPKSKGKK